MARARDGTDIRMKQIERYILRRMVALAATVLVVTTVIALTSQIFIYVNVMTSTGQSLIAFMALALTLVPRLAVAVAPFALIIAAAQTLSAMNADSELAVAEAAGAPPSFIGKPLLALAAALSIFTLLSNNFIEPLSNRQFRNILTDARGDLLTGAIRTGTFTRLDDNVYINVSNAAGGELSGIFISDGRQRDREFTYYARSGRVIDTADTQLLVMAFGQIQRKNSETGEISIIEFDSYALDLALLPGSVEGVNYKPEERSTAYLFSPSPDDQYYTNEPHRFTEEITRRFSDWLYPILFGFVALNLLGYSRASRSLSTRAGIATFTICILLRGFGFYALPRAGTDPLMLILCYAVPLAGTAFFGWLALTERRLGLPKGLARAVDHAISQIEASIEHLIERRGGAGAGGTPSR